MPLHSQTTRKCMLLSTQLHWVMSRGRAFQCATMASNLSKTYHHGWLRPTTYGIETPSRLCATCSQTLTSMVKWNSHPTGTTLLITNGTGKTSCRAIGHG